MSDAEDQLTKPPWSTTVIPRRERSPSPRPSRMINQRDFALAYSPGVASPARRSSRSGGSAQSHLARQPRRRRHQRHGGARPRQHRAARRQAGDGGQGAACSRSSPASTCSTSRSTRPTRTRWSTSSRRWSRPSAASTSRTSRRRNASIERKLRERMKIPVFHDDQHGTAIVVGAAISNGLKVRRQADRGGEAGRLPGRARRRSRAWTSGRSGLAAREHLRHRQPGVVYEGRDELHGPEQGAGTRAKRDARTLAEAMAGADVFLGVSAAGVLKQDMVSGWRTSRSSSRSPTRSRRSRRKHAKAVRPDCVIATGRSDYPNQVNNVLGFPFIFRGALDVGATTINEEMKLAATRAIAGLARSGAVGRGRQRLRRAGPLRPRAPDPAPVRSAPHQHGRTRRRAGGDGQRRGDAADRRHARVSRASGRHRLPLRRGHAAGVRRRRRPTSRVVFAEGEDERVLRAVQVIVDERLAKPVLVGRPDVIAQKARDLGLRVQPDRDFGQGARRRE